MRAPIAEVRMIDVQEVRLRTSIRGSGRPLLLITGLGASLDLGTPFERQLSLLDRQVISFDAPGIGGSTPYRRPRRLSGLVRTVTGLLDELRKDRVDVLGVSFGGAVAQQLAHQAPDRVRRLVLAATMPGLGGVPGSMHALLPLATPRRYRDPVYYQRIAGRIYGGVARRDPSALVHATLRRLQGPSIASYLAQLYTVAGWSSLPWLHTLRQPTLVLTGDDDPIVPLINARILAWRIPDASLHVVAAEDTSASSSGRRRWRRSSPRSSTSPRPGRQGGRAADRCRRGGRCTENRGYRAFRRPTVRPRRPGAPCSAVRAGCRSRAPHCRPGAATVQEDPDPAARRSRPVDAHPCWVPFWRARHTVSQPGS